MVLGAIDLSISASAKYVSSGQPYRCVIAVDLVDSEAHFLSPDMLYRICQIISISPTTLRGTCRCANIIDLDRQ